MTLGERCDEIVRLIDETLQDCEPSPAPASTRPEHIPETGDVGTPRLVVRVPRLGEARRDPLPRSA
jgi:hypothetical protein